MTFTPPDLSQILTNEQEFSTRLNNLRNLVRNELDDLYEYKSEEEENKDSIINNNSEETNESDHLGINDEEGIVN